MRATKPRKEGKIEKAEDRVWHEWYGKLDKKEHEKMLAQLGLDEEEIGEWENHKVFEGLEAEASQPQEEKPALKKRK